MRFLLLLLLVAPTALSQDWRPAETADGFAPDLVGTWQSRGYGWVLDIQPDTVAVYDVGAAGCLRDPFTEEYADDIVRVYALRTDADGRDVLTASFREANSTRYTLDRINAVPEACATSPPSDPRAVLDYAWTVMNEHFAFFDLHGVDWEARYAEVAPTVTDSTSDRALFDALVALLEGLEDDHLTLRGESDGETRRYGGKPAPVLWPALRAGFAAQDTTAEDYVDSRGAFGNRWFFDNRTAIRDELLGSAYETASGGNVFWGRFGGDEGRIGYLSIAGMGGFAEEADDGEDPSFAEEVAAVATVLTQALTDLADTDALVVDVALNQGGYDEISLAIAAHFAAEPTLGLTKYAHRAEADTRQSFTITPAATVYTKPVVVLTSDVTVSAAETFTMEMRALPQVTHAGYTTRGALSDVLFRVLPNGWLLTLSNEVYLDAEGQLWERVGIAPEQPLPMFKAGLDGHLDALRALTDRLESGSN